MKKYGAPRSIVTDGLRAYSAAMNEIGVAAERHEVGGRLNNRAENSHQPFRRRERAMQRFRSPKTLQKFSSVHAQVHNQFNQERHLVTRQVYKRRRSPPRPSGALSRHRSPLARWRSRCMSTSLRCTDTAGKTERWIRRTISLAFLCPALVKAAIDGRLPRGFGVKRLMDLPMAWPDQWSALGLRAPAER